MYFAHEPDEAMAPPNAMPTMIAPISAAKTTSRQERRARYHVAITPGANPSRKFWGRMPIASASRNAPVRYASALRHPRRRQATANNARTIDGTSLKAVPPKNQTLGKNAKSSPATADGSH